LNYHDDHRLIQLESHAAFICFLIFPHSALLVVLARIKFITNRSIKEQLNVEALVAWLVQNNAP